MVEDVVYILSEEYDEYTWIYGVFSNLREVNHFLYNTLGESQIFTNEKHKIETHVRDEEGICTLFLNESVLNSCDVGEPFWRE
jgi:hypothetical protein